MTTLADFWDFLTSQEGTPYEYGGDTPGVGEDCSGLIYAAGQALGLSVPRTSQDEFSALPAVEGTPGQGDLVFFDTGGGGDQPDHVGVCADQGCTTMINAPHTGTDVQLDSVAGFGTVMGYRSIPGVIGAGATDASLPGGSLDPLNWPGDVAGELGSAISSAWAAVWGDLKATALKGVLVVGGLALAGAGLWRLGSREISDASNALRGATPQGAAPGISGEPSTGAGQAEPVEGAAL